MHAFNGGLGVGDTNRSWTLALGTNYWLCSNEFHSKQRYVDSSTIGDVAVANVEEAPVDPLVHLLYNHNRKQITPVPPLEIASESTD